MFRFQKLLWLSICTAVCLQGASTSAASARPTSANDLAYPETTRGDTVDTYHGVSVADPFRWLENSDAADTRNWIESENKLTKSFLDRIP
jgi:prolyl oligopeptidase